MRCSKLVVAAGLSLLTLVGCRSRAAAPAETEPTDAEAADTEPPTTSAPDLTAPVTDETTTWFAAYLQGQKIGYMTETLRPTEHDGQPALEYVNTSFVTLRVLGQSMQQSNNVVVLCDPEFHPISLQFTQSSEGRSSAVTATFTPDQVSWSKTTGDSTQTGEVPIPPGVELVADAQAVVSGGAPPIGQSVTIHQFSPALLEIEPVTLTSKQTETLALAGENVETTLVALHSPSVVADTWVDQNGQLCQVKTELMAAELVYNRTSQEAAMAGLEDGGATVDLMAAAALRPDQPLPNGGRLAQLTITVAGIDESFKLPGDDWQTAESIDGRRQVKIVATGHDGDPAMTRPVEVGEALKPYLAPAEYIESDAPEIVAQAKQIIGDETNALKAVELLRDWVHGRISWQANIGMIRSALDILKDPSGVCRDAAALYAALARAAGLPTRVCGGIVWYGDRFLGHAWNETWVGTWVPVDCTRSGSFVDATHVKLAQGPSYNVILKMAPAVTKIRDLQVEAAEPMTEAQP